MKTLDNNLKHAYAELFRRYNTIAQQNQHKMKSGHASTIMQMGIKAIGSPSDFTVEKMSRWLGFAQGILFAEGLIDVNEEREISRPIIHRAYKDAGVSVPKSIDLYQELLDSWGE